MVASLPLMLGIICGFKYRNCHETSSRLSGILLIVSVVNLVCLFNLSGWLSIKSVNIVIILGIIVTSIVGLAFWIRRFRSVSLIWLLPALSMGEIAILAAVDNRFRIVVQNTEGVAVDVKDDEMALGHAWSVWGASGYSTREGAKLGKGEYYFGLLLWLQLKDKWQFCGEFYDPNGKELGNLEWKPAKLSEWPKYVILDQNSEDAALKKPK
jgi:hypothetical protein